MSTNGTRMAQQKYSSTLPAGTFVHRVWHPAWCGVQISLCATLAITQDIGKQLQKFGNDIFPIFPQFFCNISNQVMCSDDIHVCFCSCRARHFVKPNIYWHTLNETKNFELRSWLYKSLVSVVVVGYQQCFSENSMKSRQSNRDSYNLWCSTHPVAYSGFGFCFIVFGFFRCILQICSMFTSNVHCLFGENLKNHLMVCIKHTIFWVLDTLEVLDNARFSWFEEEWKYCTFSFFVFNLKGETRNFVCVASGEAWTSILQIKWRLILYLLELSGAGFEGKNSDEWTDALVEERCVTCYWSNFGRCIFGPPIHNTCILGA